MFDVLGIEGEAATIYRTVLSYPNKSFEEIREITGLSAAFSVLICTS